MDNLHTVRVAHDLKNLIINFDSMTTFLASMVNEETAEVREIKQLTQVLYKQGMLLIGQLIEEGESQGESCILNRLLEDMAGVYAFVAERKNIVLKLTLPQAEICARVNPYEMYRLLDNLLNNAIKFTYQGGTIALKLEQVENAARIVVRDSGIGIPGTETTEKPGQLGYIQPLKRHGTANENSYGQGLKIVQEMAEKNNLKVWYETSEGSGTCFYIGIPLTVQAKRP